MTFWLTCCFPQKCHRHFETGCITTWQNISRHMLPIKFCQSHVITLGLLHDIGLLASKPTSTPMNTIHNLHYNPHNLFPDPTQFMGLIGKLIYLTYSSTE